MKLLKSKTGVVLFEALFCFQLLIVLLFVGHVEIVKLWRKKTELLQQERIPYDGEISWRNTKVF
ncbi:MAG: hypothetical protein HQ462_09560 [Deltaproteobacteria bacterium]|nr:hypothetical protein [Deltaproteobacteria bacterium]